MARKDYDELKEKLGILVSTFKSKETKKIDKFVEPELKFYCSACCQDYYDGGSHTIFGIKNFIDDIPTTDILHFKIYNYICRLNKTDAQQFCQVVMLAANIGENDTVRTFESTIHIYAHWNKNGKDWMLDEIKMEFDKHCDDIGIFTEKWYFDNPRVGWHEGIRYPVTSSEFDSPWAVIENSEDILSEEEKIDLLFCQYAYAIDEQAFQLMPDILDQNVASTMPRNQTMNQREWVIQLKYNRSRDRMWSHTGKLGPLEINGNKAYVTFYRMSGHRQRFHEYKYTKDNVNVEHACAKYVMELRKDKGNWKIVKNTYYLGFIELGVYDNNPYGTVFSTQQKDK